ncbi:MAG: hypothetical protein IJX30_05890 [Clostridia bacterium]|nr:hypothetical protein [Clostridia bacterium]
MATENERSWFIWDTILSIIYNFLNVLIHLSILFLPIFTCSLPNTPSSTHSQFSIVIEFWKLYLGDNKTDSVNSTFFVLAIITSLLVLIAVYNLFIQFGYIYQNVASILNHKHLDEQTTRILQAKHQGINSITPPSLFDKNIFFSYISLVLIILIATSPIDNEGFFWSILFMTKITWWIIIPVLLLPVCVYNLLLIKRHRQSMQQIL